LDHQPRPDHVEQLVLADDAVTSFDEREQQLQRARAQLHRSTADEQGEFVRTNLEVAKTQAVVHERPSQSLPPERTLSQTYARAYAAGRTRACWCEVHPPE